MAVKNIKEDGTLTFVDTNTGTIDEDTKLRVQKGGQIRTKVLTEKQVKYNEDHTRDFNRREPYVKFYSRMMPYLHEELTNAEWMFLCLLCQYVSYEDCILRPYGKKPYNAFSGVKDLAPILKMDESLCYRRMKALYRKQLIITLKTDGVTNYAINPYIFFRGKDIENTTLAGFEETRWGQYNKQLSEED